MHSMWLEADDYILSTLIQSRQEFVDGLWVDLHHGSSCWRDIADFRQSSHSISNNLYK